MIENFIISNSFIIEQVVKTVFTVVMFLFFLACIPGINNRGRYEKDNNSDSDN